jgi:hypothetical protein
MRRGSRRVERRDLIRSVAILQNECHLQGASWLGAISLSVNDDAQEGYSVIGGRVRWPTPTTRRPVKSRGLVPFDRKQDICESGHAFLAPPVALQFADQLHPICRFRIPPRPTSGRICDMARYLRLSAPPEPDSKLIDSLLFAYQSRDPVRVRIVPLRHKRSFRNHHYATRLNGFNRSALALFVSQAANQ